MEVTIVDLLVKLSTYGPGALIGAIFVAMYYTERKRCQHLSEKLLEIATASIRSDMEHTRVNEANLKVLESIDRRLS